MGKRERSWDTKWNLSQRFKINSNEIERFVALKSTVKEIEAKINSGLELKPNEKKQVQLKKENKKKKKKFDLKKIFKKKKKDSDD